MIYFLFVLLGSLLGYFTPTVTKSLSLYVSASILAALDSVIGGILANLNKNFVPTIFISGFFVNSLLAALLTYIGNKLGINLYNAAIVVFGVRIFSNFTAIRHIWIRKFINRKSQAV